MVKNKKVSGLQHFTDEDEPYLLKIDMDWIPPKELLERYENFIYDTLKMIGDYIIDGGIHKYISPSHNGIHFIIKLTEELTDEEKLRLQFLLGDDRKRCRMNWQSIQLGMSDWNKLYISNRYKKID